MSNNLLYSDPTTRRKLVVCCANFTTSLLCSVGPVSKALKSNGRVVLITPEIISTIGLALDLVGALMIGFEFFRKFDGDKFRPDSGLAVHPKKGVIQQSEVQPTDEYAKWEARREKVAKIGLFVLCFGFTLQIVANWV